MKLNHGLTIVAIPREDDYVMKISSEKVPHMTLLFLGEPDLKPEQLSNMVGYVEHAASQLTRFGMSVDRRGKLGPKDADVLFFDKGINNKLLDLYRGHLLANDDINAAYQAAPQFPEWTPHLTLGFPETPAKPDKRDYGFNWVEFDRIAIWTGDYEGPTFQLKSFDSADLEVSMSDLTDSGEAFLEHYGVKGMKWGKRKRTLADSNDRARANIIKGTVKSEKSTAHLTNAQLKEAIERMRLEQEFSRISRGLDKTRTQKARAFVAETMLGVGKQQVSRVANDAAGQQVGNLLAKTKK